MTDKTIQPPIHQAAAAGDVEKLRKLLKGGLFSKPVDVDLLNNKFWTPLILAAHEGKLEAVKVLIEHKATLDVADEGGSTALHIACKFGHADIARYLLDAGAEALDGLGTPLLWAVSSNKPQCVKLLLERKADHTAKDESNKTALAIAKEKRFDDIMALFRDVSGFVPSLH